MLNWLKRRAKVSFNNRYTNILRRSNSPEMFLTEQSMLNQQQTHAESIKLLVLNMDGEEYILDVPLEMTLDRVKLMAIGHFYNPLEAVGGTSSPTLGGEGSKSSNSNTRYRLILARDYRTLPEEKSVAAEELLDNDEILLIKCRKPDCEPPLIGYSRYVNFSLEDSVPTLEQLKRETASVHPQNWDRQAEPADSTLDFKIALRQILITMIEASIHLIAPEDNAADLFVLVFEHLEKRHKPRIDKSSLKQLTEMGFSEMRAITALQLKRNVVEAMEWLLDETNKQRNGEETENDVLLLSPERRRSFFMSGKDPAEKVMQEFNKYVEKWFVPDSRALQNLTSFGYGEDLSKEALRRSCNNEKLAMELLEGNSSLGEYLYKGFDRDSPIMSAILDSPIVQVALSKPKTLFALMVLCETPNNVNVWLSDPETHPVVSQVLRIYHAEKHRLKGDAKMEESESAANARKSTAHLTPILTPESFVTLSPSDQSPHTAPETSSSNPSPMSAGEEVEPMIHSDSPPPSNMEVAEELDKDDDLDPK